MYCSYCHIQEAKAIEEIIRYGKHEVTNGIRDKNYPRNRHHAF
jgi:hypothetical protein